MVNQLESCKLKFESKDIFRIYVWSYVLTEIQKLFQDYNANIDPLAPMERSKPEIPIEKILET